MAAKKRAMGARPPVGAEWELGRTVDEIIAVYKEARISCKTPAEVAAGVEWKRHLPKKESK